MSVFERFQQAWKKMGSHRRILLAVSGGPDSMGLLHLFLDLPDAIRPEILVGHFDHGLRGENSLQDAEFVRTHCSKLALHFYLGGPDSPYTGTAGLEQWARDARYQWLGKVARTHECSAVATGHHADDQAETVLMNIFRGAGLNGLAGIPPRRRFSPEQSAIALIRPLLSLRKAEIVEYLKRNDIPYRHDDTNELTDRKRNQVRHTILPLLSEQLECNATDALLALSVKARETHDLLQCEARRLLRMLLDQQGDSRYRISLPVFRNVHGSLRDQVLLALFSDLEMPSGESISRVLESIRHLIEAETPQMELSLPGEWSLLKRYDELVLQQARSASEEYDFMLPVPGFLKLPGGSIVETSILKPQSRHKHPSSDPSVELFDLDAIRLPLSIRTRRQGDRISIGPDKTKKLKDLFIDRKVPNEKRDQWPILADADGTVLWVIGLRRASHAWVTEHTRRTLSVKSCEG